jgi:hypothetical protein
VWPFVYGWWLGPAHFPTPPLLLIAKVMRGVQPSETHVAYEIYFNYLLDHSVVKPRRASHFFPTKRQRDICWLTDPKDQ